MAEVVAESERVLERWPTDRRTYIRDHLVMAVVGALGAMAVLYAIGNADFWVGAIAAPLAVAVRGGYLASEDLAIVWELTPDFLRGSHGRAVSLRDVEKVRALGSGVQVVLLGGDKMMMKYLATPSAVQARIAAELPGGVR